MKEVKVFQQMYRDSQCPGREFLSAMGALGLSATAAGSFLASSSAFGGNAKRGGSVICASNLHGPDDTLDPMCVHQLSTTSAVSSHNGLIQIWDNMSLHPELAEEWSVNSNATEYTFKLRKGVTFHDGSAFSADDVIWSMNRHLGKDLPSSIKAFFASVVEWKKIDSHTVKLTLSSPDADMPIKLTQFQAKIVKKDTTDLAKVRARAPTWLSLSSLV
ncbi:MAG: hypothetical protein Ct9H300mP13_3450 [Gammaproteobacteria bacterium]|nr:MAG: hypothetical protein Ct9H300mP13_3450 [Gammaproteobacteria bacterium]